MKLFVILLLAGHGVLEGSAERIPLSNTENEKIKNKQTIKKLPLHLPYDDIAAARYNKEINVFSEEVYEEKPKRERETDKDYLKQFLKDFLIYKKFKHLFLRDNNGVGIQMGYNENDLADVTDAKSLHPRSRKRWWKNHRGRYVPGRFKRWPKRATSNSIKDKTMKLSQILEKDDNYKNYDEGLSNMAKTLAKYIHYSKIDENNKNMQKFKGKLVNKEANLVNRIIIEIKLLLTTHKGNSQVNASKILNIIRKNVEYLISHLNQACRESKLNYLIHGINTVYQRYLTNAECEGEYLDTGLDVIGWILLNKDNKKADREIDKGEKNEDDEDDELNSVAKGKSLSSDSDYYSSEARLLNSLKKKLNKKTRDTKRSLTVTSDDISKLMSEKFNSEENSRNPNKPLLDLHIKSRLLRALRSMIFHKSDRYYREIEKLFTKQEKAITGLDSIRLVCEKIATEQFLHSVEAIIWRLLHNTGCTPDNALKGVKEKNEIKPVFVDLTKQEIHAYSGQESSYEDTPDISDEGSLKYDKNFDSGGQNDEDAYFKYEAVPLKIKHFLIPISDVNLRNNHKRLRDYTHLRNDYLANIFDGLGKINSLKVIKQKFKDMNVKDWKKLLDNLPVIEKLFKMIYKKMPPQLQAVLDVLKIGALKMAEGGSFNLKTVTSLLKEAFLKGKGKDLFKMMADKFKKGKLKTAENRLKKFHDHTVLRNELNSSTLFVNQNKLQAPPESARLDKLLVVEVPSGIERKDQPIVELTYVFNHPPVTHYKPSLLIKHNITYDQYLENIKSIYNNDLRLADSRVQLVKVVKKEGNESQVFYETDILNSDVGDSNKSATLKLYEQFYNTTVNDDKNTSVVDGSKQSYNNNDRQIKVLKLTPSTAKKDIYHTQNIVSPIVNLKESTKINPTDIKSEETSGNVSKGNEYALKHNDSRSEEVIFDNANSVELDITTTLRSQLSSNVYIGREGKIQWNEYPIIRPKYNNKRKRSNNQQKQERVRTKN